jgi:FecR protein
MVGSKRTGMKSRGVRCAMYSGRWIPALLFMVLFAMQSTASSAGSSTIGVAASIKPSAEVGVGANLQTLSPGSELHASETVRTGNLGQADLVFIDSTNLTVGPASEVLLDQFVYDPIGSSGRVVMQAKRGAVRFVTGKQDHSAYQLKTPYGTAVFARSYDLDNGAGSALLFAYAPTDHSGKNANARSSANDAYAQAVGRGAGSVVTFEVLSEEEKRKRRDKCDVRVKVEQGEAEFTTPDKKLHKVKAGQSICVKDGGVTYSTAQAAPPPSTPGGTTPTPPVCNSPGAPGCP